MREINPRTVVWEYTLACNSKCIHCGSDAKKPRRNELTTEESIDLVDQIKEIGFNMIVLSGGEPLMRKDWYTIAKKIKSDGLNLGIISNGLNWNDETINKIVSLKPYAVGFSVDGEKDTHNYIRGIKWSHDKIFSLSKELVKNDIAVCAITSVNKLNFKELTYIRNRLNIEKFDAWQIQMASPMGRMRKHLDLMLDDNEYYKLGEFIVESREILPKMNIQAGDCIGYFGKSENGLREKNWNGCSAGIQTIGIDSDGTIRGCLSMRSNEAIEGNIRKEALKDIWYNPQKFKYTRQFQKGRLKAGCKNCIYGERCGGGCQSQSLAFFNEFHKAPYCFYRIENGK